MSDEKILEAKNYLSVPQIQRCHCQIHILWMEHRFVNFELLLFHFTHTFQRKTRTDILQRDLLDLSFCWYEILGTRYPVVFNFGDETGRYLDKTSGLVEYWDPVRLCFWASQVWCDKVSHAVVRFASKTMTPCRVHWNGFLIAKIDPWCISFPNMHDML